MRRVLLLLVCLAWLPACATRPPGPSDAPLGRATLPGDWLGGITRADGTALSLLLRFDDDTRGTLTVQPEASAHPLAAVARDGDTVRFSITAPGGAFKSLSFTGRLVDGALAGALDFGGETLPVTFAALASVDPAALAAYAGTYRFPGGQALSLLPAPAFSAGRVLIYTPGLTFVDLSTGDLRGLYPLSESVLAVGAARGVGAPLGDRLTLVTNSAGAVTGVEWRAAAGGPQTGVPISQVTREVTFTSADGTLLAGRLTLPDTPGPHPAFMLLHGSNPGRREGFGQRLMAQFLVSRGIALLTYDKRGVGDSTGVYRESADAGNLRHHAEDAAAGLEFLSTQPDLDATRLGLIGGSQAGWVIPMAAALSQRVAFFVILSGPVVSVSHEGLYSSYTHDGESAANYDPARLDQMLREWPASGVDPVPVIATLRQPGLWLWGGVDQSVPVALSAENLQALVDGGQSNLSYVIFPRADHSLAASAHGLLAEQAYAPNLVHYPDLAAWLDVQGLTMP